MRRKQNDDAAITFVVYVILAIFLLPVVGLFFVCGKDPNRKTLGWIFLIVGIILWLIIAICSA